MKIVSNTSPLCYLVLIGQGEVLPKLFGEIHVTQTVLDELRHAHAPPIVRRWSITPPPWLKIHSVPETTDETLAALDPGERTALNLAKHLGADMVLLDEAAARAIAVQLDLKTSGTLGVLCNAAQMGHLKLSEALDALRKTNFRASPALWKTLYTR